MRGIPIRSRPLAAGLRLLGGLLTGAAAAVLLALLPAASLLPHSRPWVWVSFGLDLWAAAAFVGAFLFGPPAYLLLKYLRRCGLLDYALAGVVAAALTVLLLYLAEPLLFPLMGKDLLWEDLFLVPFALAGGALGGAVVWRIVSRPSSPGKDGG